jgi:hypothetical protein
MTFQQGDKFVESYEHIYRYKSVVTDLKPKKNYCIIKKNKLMIKIKQNYLGFV